MKVLKVNSPNEKNTLFFKLSTKGIPMYRLDVEGKTFLNESSLGLEFEDMLPFYTNFTLISETVTPHYEEWYPVYGERSHIIDSYNLLTINLEETTEKKRRLVIEFRVYNEGIAFKYKIPKQPGIESFVIKAERTQFYFPNNCYAYEEHGAEGEYHKVLINKIKRNCERPLTVEYPHGGYASITEAGLENYSRMLLSADLNNPQILVSDLSGLIHEFIGYGNMDENLAGEWANEKVSESTPFETPWRVMVVGQKPGDLLENNDIILNLNATCEIEDTSWITPGKLLRDMTISMEGAIDCVDYAAKRNFKYVMLDWGWYGDPFDDETYAGNPVNKVWFFNRTDCSKNHEMDVPKLVRYAESQGIGIVLYIDRRIVENQFDEVLPIYKEWGIKGIKFGFVNTGPQKWTKWLIDAVRKCAEYEIAVNIHDAYRPTGFSRTYPNLLTQEGIRGNEHMPSARHNTTLPFTRFIAGAGDYTICYFTDRKQTTCAHQLAMAVVAYSPMQSIFWYDVPSDDQGEHELEFFNHLPTVWDDTRVLDGKIGEFAVIARRKGEEWFIGAITNEQEREIQIKLNFLEIGMSYVAQIYSDDICHNSSRTKVQLSVQEVQANQQLNMLMVPTGGQAVRIIPKDDEYREDEIN